MAVDDMTPDKAVRYACRALQEEREMVARRRQEILPSNHPIVVAGIAAHDERLANLDAAMRVLRGMVGPGSTGDRAEET